VSPLRPGILVRSLACLLAGALLQLGCAGGSDGGGTPLPASQPHITSFAAAKSPIFHGEGTTLTAVFENGSGTLSPLPGTVAVTSGVAQAVNPLSTSTYTLTVTGGSGTTPATQSITVVVQPPSITSFAATPTTIASGGTAKLNGVFTGGTAKVSPGNLTLTSGVDLTVGPLTSTTTFTLTVTSPGGATTTATATVSVSAAAQPAISSFTASPVSITAGQTSILSYTFSNGSGSIDQGVGAVASGGTRNVTPAATTTYTLTVTGDPGTTPATATATVTVGAASTRTVTGTITYDFVPAIYNVVTKAGGLNFGGAVPKPVRNAIVAVMNGATALATGNTDETGHYSLTFTPPGSGSLQLVLLASTSSPSIIVQDNTDSGAAWGVGAALGSSDTLNLHATHGWTGTGYNPSTRVAAPFAILDSMYTASRAFMAARPSVVFPQLKVNWSPDNVPQSGNKAVGQIGTSHFSPSENQIYILGKAGADTDEFDSHVIVHEWAHYFERNLSRSDSPGGPHGGGDILDPRLAFGEGYGNALAAMLLPEPLYVDTLWSGSNLRAFGFDAETEPTPTDDSKPGPFSESTVMRLLYDIFDGGAGEGFDQVNAGLGTIYDVLTGPEKTTEALTTIGSFIAGLKAQGGVDAAAVNTLLAHYQIGPITSPWGDGDPNLLGMYTQVAALPYTGSVDFDGGYESNKWQQNQYWVVTGNGSQITVKTTCSQDVDIRVYRSGTVVASVDSSSGNETLHFSSQAGVKYVVVVTGFGANPGSYTAGVNITTP
jgi:hypothetical protein